MNNCHRLSKPKEKPVPPDFPQGILPRVVPAIATHPYAHRDILELTLMSNQRLHILEAKGKRWYIARTINGVEGWVPSSYIPPLEFPQSLDMRTMYNTWANIVSEAFRDPAKGEEKEKLDKRTFPWLPPEMCACEEAGCWLRKQETTLGACVHDVEILLRGVGEGYCAAWLWRQSLMWHPDKFVRKLEEGSGRRR